MASSLSLGVRTVAMLGLAVLTLGGHARAQGFKSRVDIVRTDVSVIDNKTGKPVAGLTEQDFTITEDGVRQTISTFLAESGAAESGRRDEAGGPRRTWLFIVAYDNRSANSRAIRQAGQIPSHVASA